MVTANDPSDTMTMTAVNTGIEFAAGALKLRSAPSPRHNTRGPQRSQSLNEDVSDSVQRLPGRRTSKLHCYGPVLGGTRLELVYDKLT